MKIVQVGDKIGSLVFEDKPWKDQNGKDADVLVRVQFKPKTHGEWFRKSEIKFLK